MLRVSAALLVLAAVSVADPVNGGFEAGTTGWTVTGDGSFQVLTAGDVVPTGAIGASEGTHFALLGNGPGDVGDDSGPDTAILTSSAFVVPTQGSVLSFVWDFLTAEYTPNSGFLDGDPVDSFLISLIPLGGAPVTLLSGDNASGAFSFLLLSEDVVDTPDGTAFFEHLGASLFVMDLTEGTYTLQFRVSDDPNDFDDYGFDSALLVDGVSVVANAIPGQPGVIPEPGTLVLLCAGLAGALLARRRR